MLKINPFYLLVIFYLSINFIFAIVGCLNNYVDIELSLFKLKSDSFFIAFSLQVFCCLMILCCYIFFKKFKNNKQEFYVYNKGALILLILQILFLLYNYYYGTNIAGMSIKATNPILNTFFVLLPVDILFIILAPFIKSKKFFILNSILYLISNTLRGWMGGVLLLFFVYAARIEILKISFKSLFFYTLLCLLIFFSFPYLLLMKWAMRSGDSFFSVFDMVDRENYLKLLSESLDFIFNRFQHNYHVALIWENSDVLAQNYNSGRILPFWQEGMLQTIIIKIFGIEQIDTLGQAMVHFLFYSQGSWNSNPGMAGWLIVLQEYFIFYILYVIFLLTFSFYFAKKYYNNKMLLLLSFFSIFYLFHGWIGAYVTLITYLVFFTFLTRLKVKK